jgi:hypothetical protein
MPPKGNPLARQMNELREKHAKELRELNEKISTLETSKMRDVVIGDESDQEEDEIFQEGSKEEMDPK